MLNINNYKDYTWNIKTEIKLKEFINKYNKSLNDILDHNLKQVYIDTIDYIIKETLYNEITFKYITNRILNKGYDYKYLFLIKDFVKYIDKYQYAEIDSDYLNGALTKAVFDEIQKGKEYRSVYDIIERINKLNIVEREDYKEVLEHLKLHFNKFVIFKDNKVSKNIDDIEELLSLNEVMEITFESNPTLFLDKVFLAIDKIYINKW